LSIERWRPAHENDDLSDDERTGARVAVAKKRAIRPRVVADVVEEAPPVPEKLFEAWRLDTDLERQAQAVKRRGREWAASRDGSSAVRVLMEGVADSTLGQLREESGAVLTAAGAELMPRVQSGAKGGITVSSPGGTPIMILKRDVYQLLIEDRPLPASALVGLVQMVRTNEEIFVRSTLFDNWASPWDSLYLSFADKTCLEAVKVNGLVSVVVKILSRMYDRFRQEMIEVCTKSNLYKEKFLGFFKKSMSVTKVARAIEKGSLPIAQSDLFVARLLCLKRLYDEAILQMEVTALYVPQLVTAAQRRLPIRRRGGMPVIDEDVSRGIGDGGGDRL